MQEISIRPDMRTLSARLCDQQTDLIEVQKIIDEIHNWFYQASGMPAFKEGMQYNAAVPTANGMALSMNHAAQCFIDYKRTLNFVRGIVQAIHDKQQELPNEQIRIFYAGCGPYAPFLTLIAPLFNPDEIHFTLLEINPDSMKQADKLISLLELDAYVGERYVRDAIRFEVPDADSYHILISETLDALLYRESYVPIVRNLLGQFPDNTTLIPENVQIEMNLFKILNEEKEEVEEHSAGIVFDVRKALASYQKGDKLPDQFPSFDYTFAKEKEYDYLLIDTHVHIYKDYKLKRGESSLTLPFKISIDYPLDFRIMKFTYHIEPTVELKCTVEQ